MASKQPEGPVRNRRRVIVGVVVSDKTNKTRVIDVERRVRHPFYEKIVTRRSRFYAHDEGNESREGDLVEIMSMRPLSRLKRWRLVRVLKTAPKVAAPQEKGVVAEAPK